MCVHIGILVVIDDTVERWVLVQSAYVPWL